MIAKCQQCGEDFEKQPDDIKGCCSENCKQEALAELESGSDECLSCQ